MIQSRRHKCNKYSDLVLLVENSELVIHLLVNKQGMSMFCFCFIQ